MGYSIRPQSSPLYASTLCTVVDSVGRRRPSAPQGQLDGGVPGSWEGGYSDWIDLDHLGVTEYTHSAWVNMLHEQSGTGSICKLVNDSSLLVYTSQTPTVTPCHWIHIVTRWNVLSPNFTSSWLQVDTRCMTTIAPSQHTKQHTKRSCRVTLESPITRHG